MKKELYAKTRILITRGLLVAAVSLCSSTGTTAQKLSRPNIIFIMTDDHGWQATSAYTDSLIRTPHIDRLAAEGALMNHAYVTNALCGPSRAVILTGKYSHLNGFKGNREQFDGSQQTLPKILKNNGYRTAIVGKWHLNTDPTGFDYWNILPGQGNYYNPGFIKMGKDTVYNGYVTDITTDLALDWLDANKTAPFFLMVHQKAPHRNQMPPLENLDLFNDRTFTFPATFFDDYKDRSALQRQGNRMAGDLEVDHDNKMRCDTCTTRDGVKWARRKYLHEVGRLTPAQKQAWHKAYQQEYDAFATIKTKEELFRWQYQRYMEDYLRCVRSVDDNVGRLLNYLDANALAKNTIVIYTSDQGVFLGEHGLFDKRFMYGEAFRTPMLIRYPAAIAPRQRKDQMFMNLDVAPTLLDFAGVTIPQDMQGASMKPLLTGATVKHWRDKMYYHYYDTGFGTTAHYGMQTARYKLIHFYDPVDAWELYDLQEDSREMKNLYSDPAYARVVADLKKQLKALQVQYKEEAPVAGRQPAKKRGVKAAGAKKRQAAKG